jgi:hypothetical protein
VTCQLTPQDLTPICLQIAALAKASLHSNTVSCLQFARKAIRHKNKPSLLYYIWHREQVGLERDQFSYCLNYNPFRQDLDRLPWLLCARFNIERVSETFENVAQRIRECLRAMEKNSPPPFHFSENQQAVRVLYAFSWQKPLTDLPDFLGPKLASLVTFTHPFVARSIRIYHGQERAEPSKSEIQIPPKPRMILPRELQKYSAQVPQRMKLFVRERERDACAYCGTKAYPGDMEFHHVKPHEHGGLTLPENLVILHALCHDEVHRILLRTTDVQPAGLFRHSVLFRRLRQKGG